MKLNADLSVRASVNINDINWEDSPSAGVQRRRLEQDDDQPPVERVSTVVRFAPQSSFSGHVHAGGEEFLVLEGVFSDQHADFPAGYYIRNPCGTGHAPYSEEGCTILVKLWQMHPEDQQQIAINTRDKSLWIDNGDGGKTLPLFTADYETVCMLHWTTDYRFENIEFVAGVEYFVVEGRFTDQQDTYHKGSWLRLPAGAKQSVSVNEDCILLRKTGHLLNPISYV